MSDRFDSFVIFGEMRTGSNYLEENINRFEGLHCYGEAFNPHFVGHHNTKELFDMTLAAREADPLRLIDRMKKNTKGLPGFRFFHDHDPRVLEACLPDPRCAKVILIRNPLESYVSRKIAAETGQWRLTDAKHRRDAKIRFDGAEFEALVAELQAFQLLLQHEMQITGQTGFYIAYEDINDLGVLNGLARFLGCEAPLEELSTKLKKQNPGGLEEKVANFDEMQAALARIDTFGLTRTPNFEPRRGGVVPTYLACAVSPILHMPVKGAALGPVERWMAALDGVESDALQRGFNQKTLRQWRRHNKGGRSFSVVAHPLARAHRVFCHHILRTEGDGAFSKIRSTLREGYKVPLPEGEPGGDYDTTAHHAAFLGWLKFLKANLAGQTGVRIDAAWASQAAVLQGFSELGLPDMVIREDQLELGLSQLLAQCHIESAPPLEALEDEGALLLDTILDDQIEQAALDAYQRDYLTFGFKRWKNS
ncbi:nodulation protein NodH [Vannielia litorea]|uniref:nodulation protein NodH n=1 Tax=Vannielia litorea TaxID=1217970 RepID=UPI001BCF89EE|nr:nodulation protein NodH [Vannielia litorea]MBS8224965.1 nodulation protein NodH [Vannielia litorea]